MLTVLQVSQCGWASTPEHDLSPKLRCMIRAKAPTSETQLYNALTIEAIDVDHRRVLDKTIVSRSQDIKFFNYWSSEIGNCKGGCVVASILRRYIFGLRLAIAQADARPVIPCLPDRTPPNATMKPVDAPRHGPAPRKSTRKNPMGGILRRESRHISKLMLWLYYRCVGRLQWNDIRLRSNVLW